jgi:hypothetical protein
MSNKRQRSNRIDDEEVGYGRPPTHTRFKPGQSGNPRGRPKRRVNVGMLVQDLLRQKVDVREGNTIRRVSKLEALLLSIAARAMKGDAKAIEVILDLANDHLPLQDVVTKIRVEYVDPQNKRDYRDRVVIT